MDGFAFPSRTDTFGNIVQEALASGVPCIVTSGGRPKYVVTDGENGFVARTDEEFCDCVLRLATDRRILERLQTGARCWPRPTWESVFRQLAANFI
jgi:glycosyltransferase involved in cell wall biosynthesis